MHNFIKGSILAACVLPLIACSETAPTPVAETHAPRLVVPAAAPEPLNILVVGDSFSAPTQGLTMWPQLVGTALGANVVDHAVPGSGYVAGGIGAKPERFVLQLSEAPVKSDVDVVLIFGSTNDKTADSETIKQAAIEALSAANAIYPKAKIIVAGPQSAANSDPVPEAERVNNDAVWRATQEVPVDYFDDTLGLFTGRTDTAGPDNFHPNQAGQQLLADHFISIINTVEG